VHGDALVDIPFTKKVREELVVAGRAERHHILPESGWVSVWLREEGGGAGGGVVAEVIWLSHARYKDTHPSDSRKAGWMQ
jgi:Family of unknown function (DUF5519)